MHNNTKPNGNKSEAAWSHNMQQGELQQRCSLSVSLVSIPNDVPCGAQLKHNDQ